jgi:hypothetical protein
MSRSWGIASITSKNMNELDVVAKYFIKNNKICIELVVKNKMKLLKKINLWVVMMKTNKKYYNNLQHLMKVVVQKTK